MSAQSDLQTLPAPEELCDPPRPKVCIVKQHTTYDLFTRTGPDLRAIVESSNWRSGPLGLWEAFEATACVVYEDPAPECQIGKSHWSRYVEGWDIWPSDGAADAVDEVDWSVYDAVIAIDVAVPSRVVARFPEVMWCYYFIEGGPTGIDGPFRGSPYFGYNVFLNHRLARGRLTDSSPAVRQMKASRRAVLDFPYYMQSSTSVIDLYPELDGTLRAGLCLSHHSREICGAAELAVLKGFGPVRTEWSTISDIHRCEIESLYYVVLPGSTRRAGLGVIEAVSAGCLVLAPSELLWGFPELVLPELDFSTFDQLIALLVRLAGDPEFAISCRARQQDMIGDWCYDNPSQNLEVMLHAFRASRATPLRQSRAESRARIRAMAERGAARVARTARHAIGGGRDR